MRHKIANQDSVPYLIDGNEFDGSNFSARWYSGELVARFRADNERGAVRQTYEQDTPESTYLIYSYATIIGSWTASRGWCYDNHYHTRTTRKHQRYIKRAIAGSDNCICGWPGALFHPSSVCETVAERPEILAALHKAIA